MFLSFINILFLNFEYEIISSLKPFVPMMLMFGFTILKSFFFGYTREKTENKREEATNA